MVHKPYEIYNVGNGRWPSLSLTDMVHLVFKAVRLITKLPLSLSIYIYTH